MKKEVAEFSVVVKKKKKKWKKSNSDLTIMMLLSWQMFVKGRISERMSYEESNFLFFFASIAYFSRIR